jgi:hypothetical protein
MNSAPIATLERSTDYEKLYRQSQLEIARLKGENRGIKDKLSDAQKALSRATRTIDRQNKRLVQTEKEAAFRQLIDKVCRKPSKLLTGNEKIILRAIVEEIWFGSSEGEGDYTKISLGTIACNAGKVARVQGIMERLIRMELIVQRAGEHLDGEFWVRIPDNILERLDAISSDFERKWHAPLYCFRCHRQVVPLIEQTTFERLRCPDCKDILRQGGYQAIYQMGEEIARTELDDVASSRLQEAVLSIEKEEVERG